MPESYASLLLLSRVDFIEKLKSGQFTDIQGFCKAVQVSAKGGRSELESRLLDYKDKHDARADAFVPISTPERRDGRRRSPYRGEPTGNAWPLPDPLPDPWKTAAMDQAPTASKFDASIGSPTRTPDTPLAELKARAIRVRKALDANLPQPPTISPDLIGRERELAEEAAAMEYQPTSRDIMAAISTLSRSMVVREEIRADIAEAIEPLKDCIGHIESTLDTVQKQTGNLNSRLLVVETGTGKTANRVDQLESEIKQMRERLASSNVSQGRALQDTSDARRCISFKGFKSETASERVKIIEAFFAKHFGTDFKYACVSHELRGPFQNKQLTATSFIMFFDQYSADEVFKKLKSDDGKYKCVSASGEVLKINRRKTPTEKRRDYCLGRAEEIFDEMFSSQKLAPAVKISWKERKVTVDGQDAFIQGKTDDRGSFCGAYSETIWTDRTK